MPKPEENEFADASVSADHYLNVVKDGVRCPRCRNYHTLRYNFNMLCDRCADVLIKEFRETRPIDYIGIQACYEAQRVMGFLRELSSYIVCTISPDPDNPNGFDWHIPSFYYARVAEAFRGAGYEITPTNIEGA